MLNITLQPIQKEDSFETWRQKYNLAAQALNDIAIVVDSVAELSAQFRYIPPASGLDVTIAAGKVRTQSSVYDIAQDTLTLTDNATNYVFINAVSNIISASTVLPINNTTIPLYVFITAGGVVTDSTDLRTWATFAVDASPVVIAKIEEEIVATPSQIVFTTSIPDTYIGAVCVYVDGIRQSFDSLTFDYTLASNGGFVEVSFVEPIDEDSRVLIVANQDDHTVFIQCFSEEIAAVGIGQTDFVITNIDILPADDTLAVYIDGVRQTSFTITTTGTDPDTIVLDTGIDPPSKVFVVRNEAVGQTNINIPGGNVYDLLTKGPENTLLWKQPYFDASVITSGVIDPARLPFATVEEAIAGVRSDVFLSPKTFTASLFKEVFSNWTKRRIGKRSDFSFVCNSTFTDVVNRYYFATALGEIFYRDYNDDAEFNRNTHKLIDCPFHPKAVCAEPWQPATEAYTLTATDISNGYVTLTHDIDPEDNISIIRHRQNVDASLMTKGTHYTVDYVNNRINLITGWSATNIIRIINKTFLKKVTKIIVGGEGGGLFYSESSKNLDSTDSSPVDYTVPVNISLPAAVVNWDIEQIECASRATWDDGDTNSSTTAQGTFYHEDTQTLSAGDISNGYRTIANSLDIWAGDDIKVYKNGVLQTLTTHYTIDYVNRRVNFVSGWVATDVMKFIIKREPEFFFIVKDPASEARKIYRCTLSNLSTPTNWTLMRTTTAAAHMSVPPSLRGSTVAWVEGDDKIRYLRFRGIWTTPDADNNWSSHNTYTVVGSPALSANTKFEKICIHQRTSTDDIDITYYGVGQEKADIHLITSNGVIYYALAWPAANNDAMNPSLPNNGVYYKQKLPRTVGTPAKFITSFVDPPNANGGGSDAILQLAMGDGGLCAYKYYQNFAGGNYDFMWAPQNKPFGGKILGMSNFDYISGDLGNMRTRNLSFGAGGYLGYNTPNAGAAPYNITLTGINSTSADSLTVQRAGVLLGERYVAVGGETAVQSNIDIVTPSGTEFTYIYVNGTLKTITTDYTLDVTNNIVNFVVALTAGDKVDIRKNHTITHGTPSTLVTTGSGWTNYQEVLVSLNRGDNYSKTIFQSGNTPGRFAEVWISNDNGDFITMSGSFRNGANSMQLIANKNVKPFFDVNSIAPPVGILKIVAHRSKMLAVSKSPLNTVWLLENKEQGGEVIHLENTESIVGANNEYGRFYLAFGDRIMDSVDGRVWNTVYVDLTTGITNQYAFDMSASRGSSVDGKNIKVAIMEDKIKVFIGDLEEYYTITGTDISNGYYQLTDTLSTGDDVVVLRNGRILAKGYDYSIDYINSRINLLDIDNWTNGDGVTSYIYEEITAWNTMTNAYGDMVDLTAIDDKFIFVTSSGDVYFAEYSTFDDSMTQYGTLDNTGLSGLSATNHTAVQLNTTSSRVLIGTEDGKIFYSNKSDGLTYTQAILTIDGVAANTLGGIVTKLSGKRVTFAKVQFGDSYQYFATVDGESWVSFTSPTSIDNPDGVITHDGSATVYITETDINTPDGEQPSFYRISI